MKPLNLSYVNNCKELEKATSIINLPMRGASMMSVYVGLGIIGVYVLLSLLLVPIQYKYLKQLKETHDRNKDRGITVEDHYDQMSFETQQLHFNAQGNLLFIGANLLATLVYNWRNRKRR
jgi:hypothetical protein